MKRTNIRRPATLLALALAACAADEATPSADAGAPADATGSTDAAPDAAPDTGDAVAPDAEDAAGPGDTGDAADATANDETPPVLADLVFQPNPKSVLSGLIAFETDEPATWTLTVTDQQTDRSWAVSPPTPASTKHNVPVLGLRASRTHRFRLEVKDAAGNTTTDESLSHTTAALPDDFPPLKVLKTDPSMQGEVLVLNVLWWGQVLGYGLLLGVDGDGEVVWYERASKPLVETRRTEAGTLLVVIGESDGFIEMDMLGTVVNQWIAKDLGLDSLHHTVGVTADGNLLGLSTELRNISGYPPPDGTETWPIVGDVAVELTREGDIVRAWPLLDVLDPYHYNPNFFQPFWLPLYPVPGLPKDWSHGNAIAADTDGGYIVSLATQDLIVKLDRDTGQTVWKLGESGDVVLEGPGGWFSMPHGLDWTGDGRVLLYDDGIYKPEPRGRVVEYTLTPPSGGGPWTAKETFSWDGGDEAFTCMGPADVDRLPGGDLLVLHGSLLGDPKLSPFDSDNPLWARLERIRTAPLGERVFGLEVGGPWDPEGDKYSSFTVELLPGLYPPGWEVTSAGGGGTPGDCATACEGLDCGWKDGCACGLCGLGEVCTDGVCATCAAACEGRACGMVDVSCDCGSCGPDLACDPEGACVDEATFCAPYCEGKDCGVVGAFYIGQSCDCGTCPDGETCHQATFTCAP